MKRVVVVTGASRGLGLDLTRKFLEAGDEVFGISRRKSSWQTALRDIPASRQFARYGLDLTVESKVRQVIRRIHSQAGRIDILINNAGYGGRLVNTEEHSLREFQKHLAFNLQAAFLMCKYAIPIFQKQKSGLIINIASMAGKRAVPRLFAYSAAKSGLLALSQCIAKENVDVGLKCVTVCPGGMNTKMRSDLFGAGDAAKEQSTEYVSDVILKIIANEVQVESGGDIVIRHGKITDINPAPPA